MSPFGLRYMLALIPKILNTPTKICVKQFSSKRDPSPSKSSNLNFQTV